MESTSYSNLQPRYTYAPDNKVSFITTFTIVILAILFILNIGFGGMFWLRAHFSRIHRTSLHTHFDIEKTIRPGYPSAFSYGQHGHGQPSQSNGCTCGASHASPSPTNPGPVRPSSDLTARNSSTPSQHVHASSQHSPAPAYTSTPSAMHVIAPPVPSKDINVATAVPITNIRTSFSTRNPYSLESKQQQERISTSSILPAPLDIIRKSVRNVRVSVLPVPEEDEVATPHSSTASTAVNSDDEIDGMRRAENKF